MTNTYNIRNIYFTHTYGDPTIYCAKWNHDKYGYYCPELTNNELLYDHISEYSSHDLEEIYNRIQHDLKQEEKQILDTITVGHADIINEYGFKLHLLEGSYIFHKKDIEDEARM